jgi:hypothetical protein
MFMPASHGMRAASEQPDARIAELAYTVSMPPTSGRVVARRVHSVAGPTQDDRQE